MLACPSTTIRSRKLCGGLCPEALRICVSLWGAGRVGKTSILYRFIRGEYDDRQVSTLQASYLDKKIQCNNQVTVLAFGPSSVPVVDAVALTRTSNYPYGTRRDKSVFLFFGGYYSDISVGRPSFAEVVVADVVQEEDGGGERG